MLKFLAEDKDVYRVRNEISLDDSLLVGDPHFEPSSLAAELHLGLESGISLSSPCLNTPNTPRPTGMAQTSVSEVCLRYIYLACSIYSQ